MNTVAGDELTESIAMRLLMVFLPRRRVSSSDVRVRGGGRVKPVATFLSLLRVQFQTRPPSVHMFHLGP